SLTPRSSQIEFLAPTRGFDSQSLTLGVLRPLARLVAPVLLALDLARIARQHPALAQRRPQRLGRADQRARNPVTDRVGLRRDSAALDVYQHIVLPYGLGRLERLQNPHSRRRAREVVLECALVNRDRAAAGQHSDPRHRGLAPPRSPDDVFLFCHVTIVPCYTLTVLIRRSRSGLYAYAFGLLCCVRMLGATINLELIENLMAESILRQHSLHRNLEQPLGLGFAHLACRRRADSARPSRVAMIQLAQRFRSRQANLGGVDDNDEIAGILVGGVIGPGLAGQQACRARRDSSERSLACIDHHPVAVAQPILARDAAGLFG